MSDDYAYWRASLEGGYVDLAHPDLPQCGRWRLGARRTNGKTERLPRSHPVAIWKGEDGKIHVLIGSMQSSKNHFYEDEPRIDGEENRYLEFAGSGWLYCKPANEADYQRAVAGQGWPDENETVTKLQQAPIDDTFEAVRDAVQALEGEARKLLKAGAITTKEEADRASDVVNMLGILEKKAEELRKSENKPHQDAVKSNNTRWDTVTVIAAIGKQIKLLCITPFLSAQKAAREKAEADALAAGVKAEPKQEGEYETYQPSKDTAGSRGRGVHMRTFYKAKITDYALLLNHFKDNARIKTVLEDLAQQAASKQIPVPGMTIESEERAV